MCLDLVHDLYRAYVSIRTSLKRFFLGPTGQTPVASAIPWICLIVKLDTPMVFTCEVHQSGHASVSPRARDRHIPCLYHEVRS